ILLRPLQFDSLMLGCGWGKCGLDTVAQPFAHKDIDTVNCDIEFNPSVICFWGDEKQCAFFKKRYKFIYDEGPIITFIDNAAFYRCCTIALQSEDSYIVLGGHLFELSERAGFDGSGFPQRAIDAWTPPANDFEHVELDHSPLATYRHKPRIYRPKKKC